MAETIRWTRDKYPILPAGRQFRAFVIAAKQDGIEWRGEDFEHFQTVVTETERMRKMGVEAYKAMADDRPISTWAKQLADDLSKTQ